MIERGKAEGGRRKAEKTKRGIITVEDHFLFPGRAWERVEYDKKQMR
jgi:hypothetical protein